MGGKKGKKSKKKKSPTKAQKMAKARIAAKKTAPKATKTKSTPASTGRAPSKVKTKAQQMATARIAAKKTPSQGGSISKGTTGIGPVKSGATYSKAVSKATNAPTKRTSGIGPYADGAKYAAALKASPPRFTSGTMAQQKAALSDGTKVAGIGQQGPASNIKMYDGKMMLDTGAGRPGDVRLKPQYQIPTKTAMLGGDNMGGPAAVIGGLGSMTIMGANAIKNLYQNTVPKFREKIEQRVNPDADKISAVGNLTGLGIGPAATAPSYFSIKSPESFGAPSQEAVDKAAGITAGGLNVGGSGFTPSSPSGGSTSRAIRDMTSEQLADRYDASLNPNSFKGLSDGQTFGVGPVASGDAYARGLNTDNKNVENRLRQVRNLGSTLTGGLIPPVRKLADKEIADRRIKNAAFRQANLVGRNRGGGGARLPVAPLTPEEILLPLNEMPGLIDDSGMRPGGPYYEPVQTGVDPNRLMQIQQQAYQQAYNPTFNPMFRFFDRRRPRGGAFRRAFRRD